MRKREVEKAKKAASEFMRRADAVIREIGASNNELIFGSKKTGALRRSSMELTRALAEMRKP